MVSAGGERPHPGLRLASALITVTAALEGKHPPRCKLHQWDSPRGKCRLPETCSRRARRVAATSSSQAGGRTGAHAGSPMETLGRNHVPSTPRAEPAPPAARRRRGAGEMPRGAGAARGEGKGFSRDWARFPVL